MLEVVSLSGYGEIEAQPANYIRSFLLGNDLKFWFSTAIWKNKLTRNIVIATSPCSLIVPQLWSGCDLVETETPINYPLEANLEIVEKDLNP